MPQFRAILCHSFNGHWNPSGLMLSDVGEPEFVNSGCSEIAFNEIVVNWWTSFYSQPAFLGKDRPEVLLGERGFFFH